MSIWVVVWAQPGLIGSCARGAAVASVSPCPHPTLILPHHTSEFPAVFTSQVDAGLDACMQVQLSATTSVNF